MDREYKCHCKSKIYILNPKPFHRVILRRESVADKILTFMLGENFYDDMVDQGLYYGKITIGE